MKLYLAHPWWEALSHDKVQWADAYARHLTRALWRCITRSYKSTISPIHLFIRVASVFIYLSCRSVSASARRPQPPLQPAGLLASALERVRQRSQADGYDVQAALSVWLPGPRAIPSWFPEHLHLLGSYELRGRNVEIVRRDFANVPPQEAYRFLDYTLGSTSTPGAWRVASAAFRAAGGLAAGLQYPFLGYRLMTAYHTITPPPSFFTHMQLTAHWKRGIGVSYTHSMTRTWKNAVHWRRYLTDVAERWWVVASSACTAFPRVPLDAGLFDGHAPGIPLGGRSMYRTADYSQKSRCALFTCPLGIVGCWGTGDAPAFRLEADLTRLLPLPKRPPWRLARKFTEFAGHVVLV